MCRGAFKGRDHQVVQDNQAGDRRTLFFPQTGRCHRRKRQAIYADDFGGGK